MLKVAALFKIGNSKELPAIPDHLSDEGKDFVRQCLQRNPMHRPTAAQLLDHSFVKNVAPSERPVPCPDTSDPPPVVTNGVKSPVYSTVYVVSLISIGPTQMLLFLFLEGFVAL